MVRFKPLLGKVIFSSPYLFGGPGAHPASSAMGTGALSQGQSDLGLALTTHPHLEPKLKTHYSYTSSSCLSLYGTLLGKLCICRGVCIISILFICVYTHTHVHVGGISFSVENNKRSFIHSIAMCRM
jgi:hypothetical protein